MTLLLDQLRASAAMARELHAALHAEERGDLPVLSVAFWTIDPYGAQEDGRYVPALVCVGVSGIRLGWVAHAAKPRKTARGVRLPAGWACWAGVDRWPYHQGCRDEADGVRLVTEALQRAGWTVHALGAP